jgi:uncharacterized protein YbcI
MNASETAMAKQIADVAIANRAERTGHAPSSATVVLSDDTLVITLYDALTPAEKALATNSEGAAQIQEFHRQLFHSSEETLRKEIKRITGREVREAAAEIDPTTGMVIQAFTTGNVVHVFLLTKRSAPLAGVDLDSIERAVDDGLRSMPEAANPSG